jgi:hypothetical protein
MVFVCCLHPSGPFILTPSVLPFPYPFFQKEDNNKSLDFKDQSQNIPEILAFFKNDRIILANTKNIYNELIPPQEDI